MTPVITRLARIGSTAELSICTEETHRDSKLTIRKFTSLGLQEQYNRPFKRLL